MNIASCIAMLFISLKVCLISLSRILNLPLRLFMEGICMVALVPTIMTIKGSTFHTLFVKLSFDNWYFSILVMIVSSKNILF